MTVADLIAALKEMPGDVTIVTVTGASSASLSDEPPSICFTDYHIGRSGATISAVIKLSWKWVA